MPIRCMSITFCATCLHKLAANVSINQQDQLCLTVLSARCFKASLCRDLYFWQAYNKVLYYISGILNCAVISIMYTLTNIQSAVNMQMHVCNCCDELYFVVVCLLPNFTAFREHYRLKGVRI